ncbi:hypothetical protein ACP0HM_05505 [Escherichia coli]
MSLTLLGQHDAVAGVAFPYFGGIENPHFRSVKTQSGAGAPIAR